jgi:hypothetical protein
LLRFQVPPTTSSPHTDTTMSVSNDFNKLRGFSMLLPPTSLMTIIEPTTSLDYSHTLAWVLYSSSEHCMHNYGCSFCCAINLDHKLAL